MTKQFDFQNSVEIALRTWYPKDDDLHFNPHHPLGKLLGEWGELLDDYMKGIYKPDYIFEPLDELGDIWYYSRILAYQHDCEPAKTNRINVSLFEISTVEIETSEIEIIVSTCLLYLSKAMIENSRIRTLMAVDVTYSAIMEIGRRYNISLSDLTQSNWQKLKPGSERGDQWAKAREPLAHIGGKIEKGETK